MSVTYRYEPSWEDINQEDDSSPELLDAYADAYWGNRVSPIEPVDVPRPNDRPWWAGIPLIGDAIYESPIGNQVGQVVDRIGDIPLIDSYINAQRNTWGWADRNLRKPLEILLSPTARQEFISRQFHNEDLNWGNLLKDIAWQVTGDKDEPLDSDERFAQPIETFGEEEYATLMDQVAGMDFADPFQDEIIKLAMADLEEKEEEEEGRTGPSWDPMGLTNLLGDQIGLINQLTQAGLMNAEQWRDTTLDTLDRVYGDLQTDFQRQVDTLSEGELASLESLGLSADTVAGELADMGVESAVLSLGEQAIADAMALQSGNQMDFAQNLISSAQIGQADRETSAMNAFNDIVMGIQTGQTEQIGQLQNMAQAAQVQGQALGVDPMILFADMLYGTGIAQQQMGANASAAADAQLWADAEYLAQRVPDFGGDPMLAYSVLSGQLPGNYFKPTEGSYLDSLAPGTLGALSETIQDILMNNPSVRFEDAVRLAEDALYFNPME
jgi:hypothetical protein